MTKRDVLVIHCPDTRCSSSVDSEDVECENQCDFERAYKDSKRIILIEQNRNQLYIGKKDGITPLGPPWQTTGWESIFLGAIPEDRRDFSCLTDAYIVGPYLSLFLTDTKNGITHIAVPLVRSRLEFSLLYQLGDQAHRFNSENSLTRQNLSDRLVGTSSNVNGHILQALPEINEITRCRIAEIVSHQTTVLGPLLPILLDEYVEEIYLDRPGTEIYFDHQTLGRCISSVTLTERDVSRLTTLLRAESNLHLDRRNPSLKTDLKIYDTPLRVAASLPPLSPDGLHLEIRRARRNPFTLVDLIKNKTITVEGAALLLLAVALRLNITITGGPGTGKTTLLNALDMSTPSSWRKIYIEDAIESRIQQNRHQIRIRVDPVDETLGLTDKSSEIVKSLHRSPDYLILGEIQTAEHSQALFQAIAAGIPTMQTCHSGSAAGLISRWGSNHGIETSNIAMMDIVVTLNRPVPGKSKRLVKEISEVKRDYENGIITFKGLHRLYGSDHPVEIKWDKNSSYRLHALERIHQNLKSAYDTVIATLYTEMSNHPSDNSDSLCEKAGLGLLPADYC